MAENKDAFVCYRSYIEAITLLPEDKRWSFFEKVVIYALDGVDPGFNEYDTKLAFTLMKANIDSCNNRYSACVENGKKGGAPFGNSNAKKQPKNNQRNNLKTTQNNPNDNVNVNDTLSSVSEGGGLTASPPPRTKLEKYQVNGIWYEEYIANDGEKRVRKLE